METYNIGVDRLEDSYDWGYLDQTEYVWMAYWYDYDPYNGQGEAISLRKDGTLDYRNLGHCSCYGPLDNSPQANYTVEEFVFPKTIHNFDIRDELVAKVKGLLGK